MVRNIIFDVFCFINLVGKLKAVVKMKVAMSATARKRKQRESIEFRNKEREKKKAVVKIKVAMSASARKRRQRENIEFRNNENERRKKRDLKHHQTFLVQQS